MNQEGVGAPYNLICVPVVPGTVQGEKTPRFELNEPRNW